MSTCPFCNSSLEGAARFCAQCGADLRGSDAADRSGEQPDAVGEQMGAAGEQPDAVVEQMTAAGEQPDAVGESAAAGVEAASAAPDTAAASTTPGVEAASAAPDASGESAAEGVEAAIGAPDAAAANTTPAAEAANTTPATPPAGATPPATSATPPAAPATPPASPKKKAYWKPLVISLVAVAAVVAIAAGGTALYENHRTTVYADSVAHANQGDYEAALAGFTSLGDYEDAADWANYCEKCVAYQQAEELLTAGDYEAAREAFESLGGFDDSQRQVRVCDAWMAFEHARDLSDAGKYEEALQAADDFSGVSDVANDEEVVAWLNETTYSYAGELFEAGRFYSAYETFERLGAYRDSSTRAQSCLQPKPSSSELYHNGAFVSSSTDIVFDASGSTLATYLKVYQGNELVSSLFVNPGESATIQVPPGTYSFKKAQGAQWFGENDMFGDEGVYRQLLFDGDRETYPIEGDSIYTVTLDVPGGGNVGDRTVDMESF